MQAILYRKKKTNTETEGHLFVIGHQSVFMCWTLERPWKDNQKNISCIPEGEYECSMRKSPRFGYTYHVKNVKDRSYILIHSGNIVSHTNGCILIGKEKGWMRGQRAVFRSRVVLNELHSFLNNQPFTLKIIDATYV